MTETSDAPGGAIPNWQPAATINDYYRNCREGLEEYSERRAAELLASTEQTIDSISQEVGYQNPFVFSNAFTKWIGWRPSEYRRKKFNKA